MKKIVETITREFNARSKDSFQHSVLVFLFILFGLLTSVFSFSQSKIDSIFNKINPQKYSEIVANKSRKLEDKIVEKSAKVLSSMKKKESAIYKKMLKSKDSLFARNKLNEIEAKYAEVGSKLKNPALTNDPKQYIPGLDSLCTSLKFLSQHFGSDKIKAAISNTTKLQGKFEQAEEIRKFIRERKEQLKTQLEKIGFVKQFKKMNREVYYYVEQVKAYKEILNDPKKRERKVLELLSKAKLFQDFMKKNSMLASLFRMPIDPNDPSLQSSLAGLQTRSQITNLLQQQVAAGGPNAQQQFQQNIQNSQSQLSELKNKISGSGQSSSDDEMPDFKPNGQKTKSFLQRVEYGTNIQTQKSSNYFPTTTDIGLSVGYKLNDKSIIGIGGSYKVGLGKGWNNINITHQGLSLRTFVDLKLKGSLWISGGYEQNYKTAFSDFDQLRDRDAWQKSGLIGISKTVPIKTKLLKKTSVKLLWDFLSYSQIPQTVPIIFRIGYSFN